MQVYALRHLRCYSRASNNPIASDASRRRSISLVVGSYGSAIKSETGIGKCPAHSLNRFEKANLDRVRNLIQNRVAVPDGSGEERLDHLVYRRRRLT
jgi:hypothetical protein